MRAVVLSAPGELAVAEVDCPQPGSGEVLVKVAACGVCGHDQADRAGLLDLPLPAVLGHEIAGTVVAGGTRFAAGARVAAKQFGTCGRCEPCVTGDELRCPQRAFLYGGFAEYAVLPESALLPVPPGVSLAEAAVVACAVGTGLQALRRVARVKPGETVLVTGAGGGLGLHAVQVAAALGARVLALTGNPDKAAQLGNAAQVVLAGDAAGQDILDLTGGRGVDVVLDNTGLQSVFRRAFRALAHAGRYVLTGQVSGEPIRVHPAFVFEKEAVITGSGSTLMRTFAEAMALVAEGRVRPVVSRYPFEDAARAFTDRVAGRAVLVPSGGLS
ncbi:alcohol dehydrogenase catalytic domain-containing protein [Amycolatopsis echigonensis]|uniref:alcohol dehydrogenase n=1 Tax=Amycolatopsis echigonensis TaxID=2576905 RepID=A0A2N3WSU8_9PSEU|nr:MULTISPECIES: zinc-binding dehydrogenase [Amycolatopsis]MBB2498795.1 zinc-binding dehydrogenase [Amycolatopsis echigonensis]PKV96954.1 D-arabinose 1-dehydrogenase-like Zn-dependent alcohol dehydrogenase [Amycolatopsis niigatensis]